MTAVTLGERKIGARVPNFVQPCALRSRHTIWRRTNEEQQRRKSGERRHGCVLFEPIVSPGARQQVLGRVILGRRRPAGGHATQSLRASAAADRIVDPTRNGRRIVAGPATAIAVRLGLGAPPYPAARRAPRRNRRTPSRSHRSARRRCCHRTGRRIAAGVRRANRQAPADAMADVSAGEVWHF